MEVIYFLLPLSLILGILFLIFFIWSTKTGQYDDLETPAHRMLLEDENILTSHNKNQKDGL